MAKAATKLPSPVSKNNLTLPVFDLVLPLSLDIFYYSVVT